MVEVINGSLEPVNCTNVKVIWNTGILRNYPMYTLTNEAWKVNTQDQCQKYY